MKKQLLLIFLCYCFCNSSQAQFLVENFDYPVGDSLTPPQHDWVSVSGFGVNTLKVTNNGLSFTGYPGSGVGNAVSMTTSGNDIGRDFQATNTGSVYFSMMINLSAAQSGGDYFASIGSGTTTFFVRVFAKSSANGFQLGVNKSSVGTPVYTTTEYSFNTTYVIVGKYTFNTASTTDDVVSLYVLTPASGVVAAEPTTPDVGPVSVSTQTDAGTLSRIFLRQGSATLAATLTVDGIKVGDSWISSVLPLQLTGFAASVVNNAAVLKWTSSNERNVQGFYVEKSSNGTDFTRLAWVAARNAAGNNAYSLNDPLLAGISYYRLKMLDKDGAYTYSKVLVLNNRQVKGLSVYPNPVAGGNSMVSHGKAAAGATLQLVDLSGRIVAVYKVQEEATQTSLELAGLAKGQYTLVYRNNGSSVSTQITRN
jgi:hypothetical protein